MINLRYSFIFLALLAVGLIIKALLYHQPLGPTVASLALAFTILAVVSRLMKRPK